ncbi:transposase [Nostoc sp. FACHB-857]|uniref:helix-turn-helix domain-containing protein n=2 Tax=Nostoc TaxID=1177 RepID=UPI001F54E038|nr:transposase [Nostoc sp. FACHB-857]
MMNAVAKFIWMKAYSSDLRQKVIDAYKNQEGSQRHLAKRFSVSLTFIQKLLKRYRTSGTVEPKAHGGGNTAKLNNEQMALIVTLVEEDNDAILVELCSRLEERTGVKVSRATMGRITHKLNLTRKKKRCTQVKNTQNECKN